MLAPWKKSYDQPRQTHNFANKGPSSQGYGFSSSHVWMWELDYKESWAPKNWCIWTVALEKTLESPFDCKIKPLILKEISLNVHWKDWCWSWNSSTLATWCEELSHWKRPWCWERPKAGEGDDRGWDGWMASPTWWTRIWASSGSWCWSGKPGVLQSMGLQRAGHDWVTLLITDHKETRKAADFWHITDNLPFPLNQVQVLLTFFFFLPSLLLPFFFM